jgi:ABC-2 type transport system ATP-binding protein
MSMIETENLGRYFGEIKAVDGISFSVERGEVLGFLGPNGAGKSTTMKMLTCFLTPSFGSARVAGFDTMLASRQVRQRIGYLPENAPLYGEMEVQNFLRFVAEIRKLNAREMSRAIDRSLSLCGLHDVKTQRIETLSKGFKRRVGLAQALLTDPDILILDEPTDGLDPNQKHEVRALINGMAENKSIILSTHILEEVDAVCTRAIVIAKGAIVADASPQELRKRSKNYGAVTVSFEEEASTELANALEQIPGVAEVVKEPDSAELCAYTLVPIQDASDSRSQDLLLRVAREIEQRNWKLSDIRMDSGHLDEVFRDITQAA